MPRRQAEADGYDGDLLDLLTEPVAPVPAEDPAPYPVCPHVYRVSARGGGYGWVHDRDPASIYFDMWVHAEPTCRRPTHPTKYRKKR